MKILFVSHSYWPDVGGIESISELLVSGFLDAGHSVHVVTNSLNAIHDTATVKSYAITRRPSAMQLYSLVSSADVVFHNNMCARMAWPLLFVRRPWVVATHTWVRRNDGRRSVMDMVKIFLLRFATRISASQSLAADLGHNSIVVPNSYDSQVFGLESHAERDASSLVFVGRLVEAKGVDVLLRALKLVEQNGHTPSLTVIGRGSAHRDLEELTGELGLRQRVAFRGTLQGPELAAELNRHGIMVIPSVWQEPFGVVALEGAACGLALIATEGGGLPEAVGPSGLLVANGDAVMLAEAIQQLITSPDLRAELVTRSGPHLKKHTTEAMVKGYLSVLEACYWERKFENCLNAGF